MTKVSDSKDKEKNIVDRLGDLEGGEVDIKSVLKTGILRPYTNLKELYLSSRFDGDCPDSRSGHGYYGHIKVRFSSRCLREDFESSVGKLKSSKPRRGSSRSLSSTCPKPRRPPCDGDWKHARKNAKGDDCCYKRPATKKVKPEETLTIRLRDQVLYTNVKYPMRNHDLYLLVQRTIRTHSPSLGGAITIRGVNDNGRWAKHHKVVHVEPSYEVTLQKLRGKPVTVQLGQGNMDGADILKAVRKVYKGKDYSLVKESGLHIVSGANYRVSDLGKLRIVKKRKEKSRRSKALSTVQKQWRHQRSTFKKEMLGEGAGKRPCSSIEQPSNCMVRSDCVYDRDHCRRRKFRREQHKIDKVTAYRLARKRKTTRVKKELPPLLGFARGKKPIVFPVSKKKMPVSRKPKLKSRHVVKDKLLALLGKARLNFAKKKLDEKFEKARVERHVHDIALHRRGKAARTLQKKWRSRLGKRREAAKTLQQKWKHRQFLKKHVHFPKDLELPKSLKRAATPRRFEGHVRPSIAALGRYTKPSSSRDSLPEKEVVERRLVRSSRATPCVCASPCNEGYCHVEDSAIQTCKDSKVYFANMGVPKHQQLDPETADERAVVKCEGGVPRKIRRGPARKSERTGVRDRKPKTSSGLAARLAAFRAAAKKDG